MNKMEIKPLNCAMENNTENLSKNFPLDFRINMNIKLSGVMENNNVTTTNENNNNRINNNISSSAFKVVTPKGKSVGMWNYFYLNFFFLWQQGKYT